jgi:predicted ribosomally synthesized peptide with SipW-like signal peptide
MEKDGFEISRRKVLAGVGGIGVASTGAGMGTSAFFSDTERFENNQLTAGELDLKAGFQSHHSVWSEDEANAETSEEFLAATERNRLGGTETGDLGQIGCDGLFDDDASRVVVELADLKPGDFGLIAFELSLCGDPANPGYVWANARQNVSSAAGPNAENGVNEVEAGDGDENDPFGATSGDPFSGELGSEIKVNAFYVSGGGASFSAAFDGLFGSYADGEAFAMDFFNAFDLANAPTLDEFTTSTAAGLGIPLDGDLGAGSFGTSGTVGSSDFTLLDLANIADLEPTDAARDCFQADTSYLFGLAWGLDVDHANEIQTDSVAFDLGFYAEQCRHNDGAGDDTGGFGTTELDLSTGVADWQVVSVPGGDSLDGNTVPYPAFVTGAHPAWDESGSGADWINPIDNEPETTDPPGTYEYSVEFEVTASDQTLEISRFGSDNPVELFVDSDQIGGSNGQNAFDSFLGPITVTDLSPGMHVLRAVVINDPLNPGGEEPETGNPTGLLVDARFS